MLFLHSRRISAASIPCTVPKVMPSLSWQQSSCTTQGNSLRMAAAHKRELLRCCCLLKIIYLEILFPLNLWLLSFWHGLELKPISSDRAWQPNRTLCNSKKKTIFLKRSVEIFVFRLYLFYSSLPFSLRLGALRLFDGVHPEKDERAADLRACLNVPYLSLSFHLSLIHPCSCQRCFGVGLTSSRLYRSTVSNGVPCRTPLPNDGLVGHWYLRKFR
jgi:hypothetical protein